MTLARVVSKGSRADSGNIGARNYEVVSTRPLPTLEIPFTLTLWLLGPHANTALITWYSSHRVLLTRMSNAARLLAVTSWFIPREISRIVMFPLLMCGLPKLMCTMCLLSLPILRLLMTQYEFWFTTTLNFMGMVLFGIRTGSDIRLGYPFLTFMSIQVTICSDADVYTLSETARAGVLSSVCAMALGLFALHESVSIKHLPESPSKDWSLAQVNFMANVSLTLAIFIINKSYKRRFVFWEHLRPYVPLAVCRAKLSIRSKRVAKPPTLRALVGPDATVGQGSGTATVMAVQGSGLIIVTGTTTPSTSSERELEAPPSSEGISTRRRSSVVLSSHKVLDFRVVSLTRSVVDANNSLVPSMSLKSVLTNVQYALLVLCGGVGLASAIASAALVALVDEHDPAVLFPIALLSLIPSAAFVSVFAVNYQRELCRVLLRNFDFWFTLLQFNAATICLADLLDWDIRCINIITWALWFVWVLLMDALLPTHKRKLRFKKWHAAPVLVALLFNILALAYTLVVDKRNIFHNRVLNVAAIRGFFSIVISTGTFMAYRLATLWLWTSRLAWRLCFRPEEELVLLRGALEFRNPFFHPAYSRRSGVSN